MLDKLKLGLVYILESMVRHHHKKTVIDLFFHLEVVDDINAFNNYPWGRIYFQDTVHVFTRSHLKTKESLFKYDICGLPLTVQVNSMF